MVLSIPPQDMDSDDLLIRHPEQHSDSFTLFVKSHISLSRVKDFNICYYAGARLGSVSFPLITRSPEFQNFAAEIYNFARGFPKNLRDPFIEGRLDQTLFSAITVAWT
jgi:hypothetical protein